MSGRMSDERLAELQKHHWLECYGWVGDTVAELLDALIAEREMVVGHKERIEHEVERVHKLRAELATERKVSEWLAQAIDDYQQEYGIVGGDKGTWLAAAREVVEDNGMRP